MGVLNPVLWKQNTPKKRGFFVPVFPKSKKKKNKRKRLDTLYQFFFFFCAMCNVQIFIFQTDSLFLDVFEDVYVCTFVHIIFDTFYCATFLRHFRLHTFAPLLSKIQTLCVRVHPPYHVFVVFTVFLLCFTYPTPRGQ